MRTPTTLLTILPFTVFAQTNWPVEVGGSLSNPNNLPYYAPMELVIETGDIVTWTNIGGSHNVYGELDLYPDNPEGFSNSENPVGDPWTWPYTFTIPGVYGYLCTGEFNGMSHSTTQFGTITVLDASRIEENSPWGELALFPVPAHHTLDLSIPTATSLWFEVLSVDGRLVQQRTLVQNGRVQLDVSQWAAGHYTLRVADSNGKQFARSFVVE